MTTERDIYLVIHKRESGDCLLDHVWVYEDLESALASMDGNLVEGSLVCIRGITIARRDFSIFSEPALPE